MDLDGHVHSPSQGYSSLEITDVMAAQAVPKHKADKSSSANKDAIVY